MMHDDRQRAVRDLYDDDALAYQSGWAPVLLPHSIRLLDSLPLVDAGTVADAGAGTGSLLPHLQQAAPQSTVIAVDGSAGMLRRAPGGVPRAVVDLQRLGLRDGVLDVAVSAFVLFHLTDPLRGLTELARVLRPGGTIGTITWEGEPQFEAQLAWSEELDAHGAAPGTTILNHEPLSSPERMTAILRQAGFRDARAWMEPFEHRFGSEEFFDLRTSRGTSRRRIESLEPELRRRFLDRVRERFAAMDEEAFTDRSPMVFAAAVNS